jgi:hypothetical protein
MALVLLFFSGAAPSALAAYKVRVRRIADQTNVSTSANKKKDRLILEILPIPGTQHEFEGVELAPEVLSGPNASARKETLVRMYIDIWLAGNEDIAKSKGLFVLGDSFHKELIATEHPFDGRSSLFGIFEGSFNFALSTLRVAYTVPNRAGGLLHVPMIQRAKLGGHLPRHSIARLEDLNTEVIRSDQVSIDWLDIGVTYLNKGMIETAESAMRAHPSVHINHQDPAIAADLIILRDGAMGLLSSGDPRYREAHTRIQQRLFNDTKTLNGMEKLAYLGSVYELSHRFTLRPS